ncbi:MAG TPA: ATP synthase F1 subunit delta [Phycisphaerales bacterium]|nr:ATP synthase F1 subunit delta [Phycisphaerales bacterium]
MKHTARHIIHEIYSDVLFELAQDAGRVGPVLDDLEAVAKVFEAEPEFLTLLTVGQLKEEEKNAVLRRVFGGRINELTLDFLCVLARRNRLNYLFGIHDRYLTLMDQSQDIQHLEVTLAAAPDDRQIEKIKQDLKEAVGTEVKLSVQVDPDILGGIIIRKGDRVIDNSVRSLLDRAVKAVISRSKEKKQNRNHLNE